MSTSTSLLSERTPVGRDGVWLGIAAALILLMLAGLWQSPERIGEVCSLNLQQAQLVLHGAVPYCDFVDAYPPLMIYLDIPPVLLAGILGVSPILVFHLFVLFLLVITSVEIYVLLRHRRLGIPSDGRGLVLLTWLICYFIVDWRGDVGQREHLFILLYIPYLFLRILRYRGGTVAEGLAVLLGVQAAVGAAMTPLFLLLIINVELALLFTSRPRHTLAKPEIFSILIAVAVIQGHWLIVPGAMREAFFSRWLPLVNVGFVAYNVSLEQVAQGFLQSPISLTAAAAALAGMMMCRQKNARLRQPIIAMAALAGMGLILVFLQKKGWSSQRIPLNVAGLLCLAVLIIQGTEQWSVGRQRPRIGLGHWLFGGVIVGVILFVWGGVRWDDQADSPTVAALRQIVEENSKRGDRVLVVSTSTSPAYPLLVQTGRQPGSRFLYSFPIACYYSNVRPPKFDRSNYRPRVGAPREEQQFLDDLETDAVERHPQLIMIENNDRAAGLPEGFNTYDYLVYTGWTQKALEPYRELSGPEGWKVYVRLP